MNVAKRFGQEVRRVFPDAKPDSAEEGKVWRAKDALYVPEKDKRVEARPDWSGQ